MQGKRMSQTQQLNISSQENAESTGHVNVGEGDELQKSGSTLRPLNSTH